MRTPLATLALAALVVAGFSGPSTTSAHPVPATKTVVISDYTFRPAMIAVATGSRVVWTNKDDDPHTVTADDGSFDSKGLGQGDSYARVFAKPGRYAYHCSAHPFMKGVVIVTKGSTP